MSACVVALNELETIYIGWRFVVDFVQDRWRIFGWTELDLISGKDKAHNVELFLFIH